MENPWNIQSIYELQYFKCPSCEVMKHYSKQELIDHAFEYHPESVLFLSKISDNSLSDVTCPWSSLVTEIKLEEQNFNENFEESTISKSATDPFENLEEFNKEPIKTENYVMSNLQDCFTEEINDINIETASKSIDFNMTIPENIKEMEHNTKEEHIIQDSNEEIYANDIEKCGICNKTFKNNNTLKFHNYRYHSNREIINARKCEICQLPCSSKDSLRMHLRRKHPELRDSEHKYSRNLKGNINATICQICQFPCSSKGSFRIHLRRKHPELRNSEHKYTRNLKENKNAIICQICQFPCSSKDSLRKHLTKKHPELSKKEKRKIIVESVQNSLKNKSEFITNQNMHNLCS